MIKNAAVICALGACLTFDLSAQSLPGNAQAGFVNQGLVGVGRIPADTFDAKGGKQDTLGGVFSSMQFDAATWKRSGDAATGFTYGGVLYGLPDRGYADGGSDYRPRLQTFQLTVTPYYGTAPTDQSQIVFTNTASLLWTDETGTTFTGIDASDTSSTNVPRSHVNGHRSLDPEGLVRLADGSCYVSDEYGPFVYRFDAKGHLLNTLPVPAAFLPKVGAAYPRTNDFTADKTPVSGRHENRGLEGLSASPDGTRLFAMLQSPLVQDGHDKGTSFNTRILVYDIAPGSPKRDQLVAEYVYPLSHQGNEKHDKNTPVSEILALNNHQLLVLERDNRGLGGKAGAFLYKKINVADLEGATSILGTGYDLELGAPGQLSLPASGLPAGVVAANRFDWIDLIDAVQLAKFGLNLNGQKQDANTLSEKWEGLALVPLRDPKAPNDYLLLVGNDNDFKAATAYHNGVVVGNNSVVVDTMLLAWRVTLPGPRQ